MPPDRLATVAQPWYLDIMPEFRFKEAKNLGVFSCSHVWDEHKPILHISHDGDGDWQFLCGGEHEEGDASDQIRLICLEHVVERDPTVNDVADLCRFWQAHRSSPAGAWERVDGMEDIVRDNIAQHGWHVMTVTAEPRFTYTIGMYETLGAPELLCIGLKSALPVLNHVGHLVKEGAVFDDGTVSEAVLDGYACRFHRLAKKHYGDYMGYANWYYEGHDYPVLQLVYPDRAGRFPDEAGIDEAFRNQQAILWR